MSGDETEDGPDAEQAELSPESIESVSAKPIFVKDVGVPNSSNAWWGESDGGLYLVKEQTHNELVSEAVASLLGRVIGLQVPLGKIWQDADAGVDYWLSPQISIAQHWDLDDWPLVANAEDFAMMLVLDAVIGNADRHSRNVLLVPSPDHTFTAWFIDHSNSAVGSAHGIEDLALGMNPEFKIPDGLPVAQLAGPAEIAAQRVASSRWRIQRAVEAALSSIPSLPPDERATILSLVVARCADAKRITEEYISRIQA